MTFIIVKSANTTSVRNVQHVVSFAISVCAWGVHMNVLPVRSLFVKIVRQYVPNAEKYSVMGV